MAKGKVINNIKRRSKIEFNFIYFSYDKVIDESLCHSSINYYSIKINLNQHIINISGSKISWLFTK